MFLLRLRIARVFRVGLGNIGLAAFGLFVDGDMLLQILFGVGHGWLLKVTIAAARLLGHGPPYKGRPPL